jgi:LPS-assembly lipoprotein
MVTQVADENMPSAGTVTLIAEYVVSDAATARPIASGRRQITANYDIPRQEFANVRAERDAENRAARELAELLKLAVAQDLRRAG